jgi:hypothetical protein
MVEDEDDLAGLVHVEYPVDWNAVFPELISDDGTAPFSDPHTAIKILAGWYEGKWLHIPRVLDEKKVQSISDKLKEIWSKWDHKRYPPQQGPWVPYHSIPIGHWDLLGPAYAPYPMSQSPVPPFEGPHTALFNAGSYFNGWYMHVPRYITHDEIFAAERNLSLACQKPWDWGDRHGSNPFTSLRANYESRMDVYVAQKHMIRLLQQEARIDFSKQEDPYGIWNIDPPLWVDWHTLPAKENPKPAPKEPVAQPKTYPYYDLRPEAGTPSDQSDDEDHPSSSKPKERQGWYREGQDPRPMSPHEHGIWVRASARLKEIEEARKLEEEHGFRENHRGRNPSTDSGSTVSGSLGHWGDSDEYEACDYPPSRTPPPGYIGSDLKFPPSPLGPPSPGGYMGQLDGAYDEIQGEDDLAQVDEPGTAGSGIHFIFPDPLAEANLEPAIPASVPIGVAEDSRLNQAESDGHEEVPSPGTPALAASEYGEKSLGEQDAPSEVQGIPSGVQDVPSDVQVVFADVQGAYRHTPEHDQVNGVKATSLENSTGAPHTEESEPSENPASDTASFTIDNSRFPVRMPRQLPLAGNPSFGSPRMTSREGPATPGNMDAPDANTHRDPPLLNQSPITAIDRLAKAFEDGAILDERPPAAHSLASTFSDQLTEDFDDSDIADLAWTIDWHEDDAALPEVVTNGPRDVYRPLSPYGSPAASETPLDGPLVLEVNIPSPTLSIPELELDGETIRRAQTPVHNGTPTEQSAKVDGHNSDEIKATGEKPVSTDPAETPSKPRFFVDKRGRVHKTLSKPRFYVGNGGHVYNTLSPRVLYKEPAKGTTEKPMLPDPQDEFIQPKVVDDTPPVPETRPTSMRRRLAEDAGLLLFTFASALLHGRIWLAFEADDVNAMTIQTVSVCRQDREDVWDRLYLAVFQPVGLCLLAYFGAHLLTRVRGRSGRVWLKIVEWVILLVLGVYCYSLAVRVGLERHCEQYMDRDERASLLEFRKVTWEVYERASRGRAT